MIFQTDKDTGTQSATIPSGKGADGQAAAPFDHQCGAQDQGRP